MPAIVSWMHAWWFIGNETQTNLSNHWYFTANICAYCRCVNLLHPSLNKPSMNKYVDTSKSHCIAELDAVGFDVCYQDEDLRFLGRHRMLSTCVHWSVIRGIYHKPYHRIDQGLALDVSISLR
eukprot:755852_1